MSLEEAKQIMHLVHNYWYPELMCSDVCVKFLQIMKIMGVEGRHLKLTRPSTKPLQGHSSCEAKIDGIWVVFDVAFDWSTGVSSRAIEEFGELLKTHPIYETHNEELLELYNNIEYESFKG